MYYAKHFTYIISLKFIPLYYKYDYSYSMDQETDAKRGYVSSWWFYMASRGLTGSQTWAILTLQPTLNFYLAFLPGSLHVQTITLSIEVCPVLL